MPAVVYSTLGNRDLRLERSTELEVGIDGTYFGGRVTSEITWYDKLSKDALVSKVLPPPLGTGATARLENLGEARDHGVEALNFALAADARVPVCAGGDVACRAIGVTKATHDDLTAPYFVQRTWPLRESSIAIVSGAEARLIEGEAQLRGGNATTALGTLNARRAGASLPALTDAGTEAARVDQLFRERAFTLFGRGTRTGDLRRLIRQYNRSAESVFPTGTWLKGGNYGTQATIPLPLAELNNPTPGAGQCIDEKA